MVRTPRTSAWSSKPSRLSEKLEDPLSNCAESGDASGLESVFADSAEEELSMFAESLVCVPGLVVLTLARRDGGSARRNEPRAVRDASSIANACQ